MRNSKRLQTTGNDSNRLNIIYYFLKRQKKTTFSYPKSADPMCCIFLQWSEIPISRRQLRPLIFFTAVRRVAMRLTNSADLLAYCCGGISERTPTESHQSKHGLLFFTLEIIINETVHNGAAMFDNWTTILSHHDD